MRGGQSDTSTAAKNGARMPSLPSFQFYPADWRNDLALRSCSPAARGVWMDIICLLHTAAEYGVFRMKLSALANACGATIELLEELAAADVLKGSDSGLTEPYVFRPRHSRKFGDPVTLIPATTKPVWFCARLVVDEYKRSKTGEGTRFTSANNPNKKPIVAPSRRDGDGSTDGQGDGSSSLSSSLSSVSIPKDTNTSKPPRLAPLSEMVWQSVGWKKEGKKVAIKAIDKAIAEIAAAKKIEPAAAAEFLVGQCKAYTAATAGRDMKFRPMPATWFNRGSYDDDPAAWDQSVTMPLKFTPAGPVLGSKPITRLVTRFGERE